MTIAINTCCYYAPHCPNHHYHHHHHQGEVGVPKDVIQAVMLVRMAAAQGFDAALLKLANFYHVGTKTGGIAKDDQEYSRWLLLSANQGYAPAYNKAGDHFERMALDFYNKGAACGDADAKYRVKMFSNMYYGPPFKSSEDDSYDDDDNSDDDDSDSDGDDSGNYDDDGPKRPTLPQNTLELPMDDKQKAWFAYFKKLPSVEKRTRSPRKRTSKNMPRPVP